MKPLSRSVVVFLVLLVVACGPVDRRARIGYPVEVHNMADSPAFPLKTVGFERKRILAYEPGYGSLSTTYLFTSPHARLVAALAYYRKGGQRVGQHFAQQKSRFVRAHPGAVLIDNKSETITKNGQSFPVHVATYEIDAIVGDRKTRLFSELMLIETRVGYVKLRSHSPILHRIFAAHKNRELLHAVEWPR